MISNIEVGGRGGATVRSDGMALMSEQINKLRRWYFSYLEPEPCDDLAFGYVCVCFFVNPIIPGVLVREFPLLVCIFCSVLFIAQKSGALHGDVLKHILLMLLST